MRSRDARCHVVETDLGEWIIQLADQTPSHIIAPPCTSTGSRSATSSSRSPAPTARSAPSPRSWPASPVASCAPSSCADLGVSGCNFAVRRHGVDRARRERGQRPLSTTAPRVHVAVMGMERIVDTWDQLDLMINLLARSGTGQHLSTYTNILTGPRRVDEGDGPDELHIVILDNGRAEVLGSEFHEAPRLHPLRRLPQRVPRVPTGGWSRLRLGVLGSHRRSAHPAAGGRSPRGRRAGERNRRCAARAWTPAPCRSAAGPPPRSAPSQGRGRRRRERAGWKAWRRRGAGR